LRLPMDLLNGTESAGVCPLKFAKFFRGSAAPAHVLSTECFRSSVYRFLLKNSWGCGPLVVKFFINVCKKISTFSKKILELPSREGLTRPIKL
jgi:hypothetical protein